MPASPPANTTPLLALFQEHRSGLSGAIRGVLGGQAETQEILQEAFLRVWRAQERGALTTDPVGYAFVVTLNLARDHRRRRATSAADVSLHEMGEVADMTLSTRGAPPTARLEQEEAVVAARAAIGRLSDDEKDVFYLRVSGGLTFDAVAANLGIPIGTAKTRMRAALARLRTSLAPHAPHSSTETGRDS